MEHHLRNNQTPSSLALAMLARFILLAAIAIAIATAANAAPTDPRNTTNGTTVTIISDSAVNKLPTAMAESHLQSDNGGGNDSADSDQDIDIAGLGIASRFQTAVIVWDAVTGGLLVVYMAVCWYRKMRAARAEDGGDV